ncbi:MAG: hypothetical protein HZB39_21275 [Planctomycetes bacterium]|nr:hypothetical protein [Planctomycetota bacterium]
MAKHRFFTASVLVALGGSILAQSPIPMAAPRARWVLTSGVTGTPTQRRDNPGAASDSKLYVFGGRSGNATTTVLNALYEFNGTAWTLKTAEGAAGSPPARGGACVAWDFARSKLIVFGGDSGGATPALLGDTWEWDPTTNAWTDAMPATSPTARRFSAMAWEPTTGGMLLFGGDTSLSPSVCANDTWLLLGGTWIQLAPANLPPVRRQHSLMTRSDFGDVFLCAGIDSSVSPNLPHLDTWKWTGFDWANIAPTTAVIQGSANANQAVYDPLRKRVVMQGGQGIDTLNPGSYPGYGGSPTTFCSEFDCVTNEWLLYGQATFNTADPVIGRISRYYAGFVPSLGKVYKVSGQNPSGVGTTTGTCQYQATPVASSIVLGSGCNGSGGSGPVVFAPTFPTDRPWLGRTYAFSVSGLLPASIVIGVFGFTTTSIPLSVLDPAGLPGCNLLVNLDVTWFMANAGGTATDSLLIPTSTSLAGAVLHQQALQVELSGFTMTALSSSNALTITLGAL